ncbi:MAG: hypothetical protein A2X61_08695 [Ignavibacteria bacterium GWB2_35_12]|nr:MAG: hypothetical protein A2X61_08695 [Ignavibacteria bacterium GWB2_35_12]OGU97297.1 MAG: hypothetical protein A2220_07560 [Ignavibacteria bacterium RIFOXYA2_FULL_35_10]OGV22394.1 MAG: hypothetical protein A2475_15920 [Ignavibacteria bacterium RIFOXYC2_FULL_35_21]
MNVGIIKKVYNHAWNFLNKVHSIEIKLILIFIFTFFSIYNAASSQNFKLSIFENIFNGDFSQGNTGFFTDYIYSVNDLIYEGYYTITSNPYAIYDVLSPCTDHTPGSDSLMMLVNGYFIDDSTYIPTEVIWGDSIMNVIPNNDYVFSLWATSCIYREPARLEVNINGQKLKGVLQLSDTVCLWYYQEFLWNSDTNKMAIITIIDAINKASGNDFAIDDLSFRAVCYLQADAGPDVNVCEGQTAQIGRVPQKGIPPFQYSWQPALGLSNPNIAVPTVNINTSSTFNLTVTDSLGCVSYDTVTVNVIPFPQAFIITDKPATICPCDSVKLTAPLGDSYVWSTGDTVQSIFVRFPGKYSVTVNNKNLCYVTLDTQVVVLNYETSVQLDTLNGEVGDYIVIPLHVVSPVDQACALGQFDATISYNKSLLLPTGNTPLGTINGNDEIINISGTAQGKLLNNFEFIAALGNAECTDIKLTFFKWRCNLIQVDTIYGRFCLKNLCKEPVVRLFNDNGAVYLRQARPNPASDNITIDIGIIEEGETSLEIYNIFGQKVSELLNKFLKPGQYNFDFNVGILESGSYILKLQTPNNFLYKTIQIIH